MRRQIIILIILLNSCTAKGQIDYLKYPDYDQVIIKFFEKYSVRDRPNKTQITNEIKFLKKPTGWHIVVRDQFSTPKNIKDELFWDRKKNKFKKLNFKKIKDKAENKEYLTTYLNDWSKRYFRICPFYGYLSWDWDVIQAFQDEKNLPDSTIYALGRAYSSYASNLLHNNSGLADNKNQFNLPNGKNCMTNEQLEKYRNFRHLAIEKFKKVAELNPKYETIVGSIGIKAANEYLTSFLDMRIYQNEEEANKELPVGLYTDFYIAVAKNFLNSCALKAILFTNGDNDTYPLLYVQSKYGFRTDVLVVNMSLLQTDRYINSLREQILEAPGIPISFTPEEIGGKKRDVILIEKDDDKPMELIELIGYLKNDNNTKPYGTMDYFYIPTNKFSLQLGKDVVQWKIDEGYFFRNHLIVLDVLASNKLERPIYFAITMSTDSYFGLTDYFQLEGLAYQLVSTKSDKPGDKTGFVNTTLMYDNLVHKFDWSGIKTVRSHEKLLCMNYRNNFHGLADALIAEKKMDSAKLVLDKCIEVLPNEIVYYDFFMLPIIEDYYKIGEFENGNRIGKQLAFNLKNSINNYYDITIITRSDNRDAALKRLRDLAKEYDQEELIDLINK